MCAVPSAQERLLAMLVAMHLAAFVVELTNCCALQSRKELADAWDELAQSTQESFDAAAAETQAGFDRVEEKLRESRSHLEVPSHAKTPHNTMSIACLCQAAMCLCAHLRMYGCMHAGAHSCLQQQRVSTSVSMPVDSVISFPMKGTRRFFGHGHASQ